MENVIYEYVTKDNKLYKRDINDKSKTPWDIYEPKCGMWLADLEEHKDFSGKDAISLAKAEDIKISLSEELEQKALKTTGDYVGKFIYFEGSGHLYVVENSKLDADMYLGLGRWKLFASRLTLVGVKNNLITNEGADKIMKEMDAKFTLVEKEPPEEIVDLTGKYFLNKDRLLRVTKYTPSMKKYDCAAYKGNGTWRHCAFYSLGTIDHKVLSEIKAKEMMDIMDKKVAPATKIDEVENIPPISSSKSLEAKECNCTLSENKEDVEDVKGTVEENRSVNAILNKHRIKNMFEPIPTGPLMPPKNVDAAKGLVVGDGIVEAIKTAADIEQLGNLVIPRPPRVLSSSIEEFTTEECNCTSSENTTHVEDDINLESEYKNDPPEKDRDRLGLPFFYNDYVDTCKAVDLNDLLTKGKDKKDSSIGDCADLNTESKDTIASITKAKREITIQVPMTIREGSIVKILIDKAPKTCVVKEIIEENDHNVIVAGSKVDKIADIFFSSKNLNISREELSKMIQDELEEIYIKVSYFDSKTMYKYISKSEFEKSFEKSLEIVSKMR